MAERNPELNKENLLIALQNNAGLISKACRAVGISNNQYYLYYKNDPDFKEKVDQIKEGVLDLAESKLYELIQEKNPQAIFFFLKYRGKERGYTDINTAIQINSGSDITVKIISSDADQGDQNL
jgi:hypothetical protein